MKLSLKEIVMLLNGLAVMTDVFKAQQGLDRGSRDLVDHERAIALAAEMLHEIPYITFEEIDELFTRLVASAFNEVKVAEGEINLAELPPSDYIH